MQYDFDRIIQRRGTDSVKYDLTGPVFGREDLLPMWVADMDFEVAPFITEAIRERAGHPVYGYTFRPKRFYEVLAGWISRRNGWDVDPGAINFSPGIVPALNLCIMAMTGTGDRVVVQPPVYFPFFKAVTNHDRKLIHNQLQEKDGVYSIDFDHLEEQFRLGARMLIFCHPHNPVGRVWKLEELEKVAGLCVKYGVLVISDEVHSDLILHGHRHIPLASLGKEVADLCITCMAPSKSFNLAGLFTSAVIITNSELYRKYDRILDAVHVGGGGLFGQVAMEAAYKQGDEWLDQLLLYLQKNDRILREELGTAAPEIIVSPLEATYLAWLDFSSLGMDDDMLRSFIIEKAGLGLNDGPMFGPGGSGHQRMNIATPSVMLRKAIGKLGKALEDIR